MNYLSLRTAFAALSLVAFTTPLMSQEATSDEWARSYFVNGGEGMPACGLCHMLSDAGTEAEIGPSLDELQPDETMVRAAVRDGVGVMPAFGDALDDDQIQAMAEYVAEAVN